MLKIFLCLFLTSILFACGGNIKKTDCTNNNWSAIGYETAQKGKSIRTFDEYQKTCGDTLTPSAKDTYIDGYTKGIIEFCTFENGHKIGSSNREMPDICPYEIRAEFIRGYKQGLLELTEKLHKMKEDEDKPRGTPTEKPGAGGGPRFIPL